MTERTDYLATRLREKGAATAEFFRALPPAAWQATVYTEGAAWDARQVLCHFVSSERAFLRLFEDILAGGEGSPEDFDINRFNESQVGKMADLSADELIAQFEATRAEMIALVERLDDADLEREGRHPFFGVDRLEKFVKLIYRHNMLHERDIRRALDGSAA